MRCTGFWTGCGEEKNERAAAWKIDPCRRPCLVLYGSLTRSEILRRASSRSSRRRNEYFFAPSTVPKRKSLINLVFLLVFYQKIVYIVYSFFFLPVISKAYYCKKAGNSCISCIYFSMIYYNITATDKCQNQKYYTRNQG